MVLHTPILASYVELNISEPGCALGHSNLRIESILIFLYTDASQELSGASSLFLGSGGGGALGGLGGLGGRPSNTTANPFGGGGITAVRSPPGIGGGFMSGSAAGGGVGGLLKPSALGTV